ncbi:MAG: beta/alpha barrel domain-containing protein [Planctomycetota bacterium]|jgi:isopropylmalate/homocitrate/citramalate synthase
MSVNPERLYHNYKGQFPPVTLGPESGAKICPKSPNNHPKQITDTTLRDGAQDPRFALFRPEAKLRYFDLLHKLDNETGCIGNCEVFIYLEQLLERGYTFPEVTTWTRATPKDIKLLIEVSQGKIKETGILASSSDHHIFDKLKYRSKEIAIEKHLVPIMIAVENGIRPRVHLEDTTKADIHGWVIPFMQRVMKETEGWACFRICDTVGWGVPDSLSGLPMGIPKLVSTLHEATGAELEFHGHNDFGLATANSVVAWIYGCKRVNTAFAGMGERTGNTPLEQMVAAMVRLYGNPGMNLKVLAEIAELIDSEVCPISSQTPLIGKTIFTTHAGLHQTGVERQHDAKGGLIYLPYSASVVGRRREKFHRVGGLSGNDGMVAILNQELKAAGEEKRYSLFSQTIRWLYEKVHEAYDGTWDEKEGKFVNPRTTFFEPHELMEMAREFERRSQDGNSI